MAELEKVGSLEIEQDIAFQRKEWRIQRVLWVATAVVLVLAVAGLFGTGPISSTRAVSDDETITVDYHRFVRHDGRASLTFQVTPARDAREVDVWISQGYVDNVQVDGITPQPTEVRSAGDRTIFVFAVDAPGDTLNATFALRPQHIGRLSGESGSGEASVSIDQVSYP